MPIAKPSVQSLVVVMKAGNAALGTATGFIVQDNGSDYLITNWHVVTGRNPESGQPKHSSGAIPDALAVSYLLPQQSPGSLGWEERIEPLLDEAGNPRWYEHPTFGRGVDVVALPLTKTAGTELLPYNPEDNSFDLLHQVADWVNIVGFPFGITAGGRLAVWTKGGTASEPIVDFNAKPCFLIDARTREGQSGSPVIIYSNGGTQTLANGDMAMFGGPVCRLLGVYSSRINENSDLGIVWKSTAITEIIDGHKTGDNNLMPAASNPVPLSSHAQYRVVQRTIPPAPA